MGDTKRSKRSKSAPRSSKLLVPTTYRSRWFGPVLTPLDRVYWAGVFLGAAVLGAGTYGQLLREDPHPWGLPLTTGGALFLAVILLFIAKPLRGLLVGPGGVANDAPADSQVRIAWCRVERVALEQGVVVVAGDHRVLKAPVRSHPQAAAWIVKEALQRIPGKVVLDTAAQSTLPVADENAGEWRSEEAPQVTGLHCKQSGRVIAFESDARLCPECGEVYHQATLPSACLTCDTSLG